jgi:predicted nucleotidyltransferase component of viral defense system
MTLDLIQKRLKTYAVLDKESELNAIKEILQEITLCALARTDFFKNAAFMGGTCLRILHGLPRFSEDLDFSLLSPDATFAWESTLRHLSLEFDAYNLHLETKDRSAADQAVKKAFLKEDSFGKVLQLSYERNRSDTQKILIKLEVDTNPPAGATSESLMVRFPFPFSVHVHDLPSLCAGKCHALLCREYVKGRDWFDLLWYVSQEIIPNLDLLQAGLQQQGPWQGQSIDVSQEWLKNSLANKIESIDWHAAKREVLPFLSGSFAESLKSWNKEYFLATVDLFTIGIDSV